MHGVRTRGFPAGTLEGIAVHLQPLYGVALTRRSSGSGSVSGSGSGMAPVPVVGADAG